MGHSPMEKIPSSPVLPSSPLPVPLILLTPESTNPHLINKPRKITVSRSLQRVNSLLNEEGFDPGLFCNEKGEKLNVEKEKVEMEVLEKKMEQKSTDMMNLKPVYQLSRRLLVSGYEIIRRTMRGWSVFSFNGLNGKEGMIWSMAGLALLFAAVRYVRKRDRRERRLLMLLLEEKDQRIAHMLQQITLINDMTNLRSQVPALRRT